MSFVNCEVKDKIAVVTINRPEALNALNSQVLDDLAAAFDSIDVNVVRAVVLTGAGEKSFVAALNPLSPVSKAWQIPRNEPPLQMTFSANRAKS